MQYCIEGLRKMNDAIWKDTAAPEDKELFLFSNNATITDATTDTDLTEIVDSGLEKQTLAKANFAAATDADPIVSVYNAGTGITWTATGAKTIYGWAIRGVTSGAIYAAHNWGELTVPSGMPVTVNPVEMKLDIPE